MIFFFGGGEGGGGALAIQCVKSCCVGCHCQIFPFVIISFIFNCKFISIRLNSGKHFVSGCPLIKNCKRTEKSCN